MTPPAEREAREHATAPTGLGWTRRDRRIGAALAIGLAASWLVAWLAPYSAFALREVTWLPLLASDAGRVGGTAFAAFVLFQVARHWHAPLPAGDVRSLSLPIGRALLLLCVTAIAVAAVQCAAWRLDRARAPLAIEGWSAQDAAIRADRRVSLEELVGVPAFGQRLVVGTQSGARFTREREAIWIDDLAGIDVAHIRGLDRSRSGSDGWARSIERLELAASGMLAFLVTTTWRTGRDPEATGITMRSSR